MKVRLNKAISQAMVVAILCASASLLAEEKDRIYFGPMGGFSLFIASSVDEMSFPGSYPAKPVFGLFVTETEYDEREYDWFPATGRFEVFYLAQSSFYDIMLRDDQGNIIVAYEAECLRKYIQADSLIKIPVRRREQTTLFLLAGPAMAIPLKTSREPEVEDPTPPDFKRLIFSIVFGTGLDAKIGKLLLSFDVRYDLGFDTLSWARLDPKPDALQFILAVGF